MGDITQTHRTKYRENMKFALTQKDSRLLKTVTDVDASGTMFKLDDLIEESDYYEKTERNSDTKWGEEKHNGRWVAPSHPIVSSPIVDSEDKLLSGLDVTGKYVESGRQKLSRGTDAAIIRGIFGVAQTGEKGTILTPFDTNNVVPVNEGGSDSGLTIKKLNAANEILRANDVDLDEEELWMAITAKQNSDLLAQIETVNKDYGASGAEIREGMVRKLFGFNFAHIELGNARLKDAAALTLDGSNHRKVPFYTKSGIYAAFWERLFTSVDRLPTKHYSVGVYARRQVTAVRSEEGKVGYVLCDE